ncbi:MAG: sulfatase [Mariniblastus sp.]|nr:sulfatase [Mariniblastus sp.]
MKTNLCGILLVFTASLATTADSQPPNIVLIISDDQSYTDYSFMGHPSIETPNLDQLARESVVFRRGYVPTALCRPALMTLATGLYSHQNKTTGNDPAQTAANANYAKDQNKSIKELLISHIDQTGAVPQWLAERGYVSHQSGKWWEGSYQRGGFTDGMTKGFPNPRGRHGDAGLKIGRDGMQPVLNFIDQSVADKKPFFIWYAPFMPHTPHTPPGRILKKYIAKGVQERVAKYYAMCEWFDETCGALVNHIDESGLGKNTLIVYVTDNGWIQTEAGSYAPRSKRSPYEGGTRTPIMFRWPGTITPAERLELCSSIDIVPTMLAAAGADAPHSFPGLNLLHELKTGQKIDRDTLFGESFAHDIADINQPQASLLYRWVIRGNHKLLLTYDGAPGKMKYPPQDGEPKLFNLKTDPGEEDNLASQEPAVAQELSKLLEDWYVPNKRTAGKFVKTEPVTRKTPQKNAERQKRKQP